LKGTAEIQGQKGAALLCYPASTAKSRIRATGPLVLANRDLDRLILARELMGRVTAKTRSNSKLPELVDLFLSRPLVTVPLGAKLLKVTPKAIDLMLAQPGGALPRELTGRTRYRAWGIV
jgi:hypothetical protein